MKRNILYLLSVLLLSACGGGDDGGGGSTPSGGSEYLNVSGIDIPGGNTTATLSIKASNNCEWVVKWSDSWIRNISPSHGRGDQNVTITVTPNPSSSAERTAVVTVTNTSGTITRNVTITQMASSEALELSTKEMNFTYQSGSQDFTVTSNTHWTITGMTGWLHLSKSEGDNTSTVTVSVDENNTETKREAVLNVTGDNGQPVKLTVTQTGRPTEFSVSPTAIVAEAPASTVQFNISGNARWTIQSNASWATLSTVEGEGSKSVIVTLADNTQEESRVAEITISSSTKREVVHITQAAATRPAISGLQVSGKERNEATIAFQFTSIFPVTEYGVCYSTSNEAPTTADTHTTQTGSGNEGSYSATLSGLSEGTTYHLRAYAKSVVGISYSDKTTFKTTQGEMPNPGDNPYPQW